MQLQFLGTSASEGYPDAFCDCDNCQRARIAGGPNLRKRSSVLIDGELLIDLGPDLMAASMQHNVSLAQIRYCLQTHEHSDHLDPSHFHSRSVLCGVYGNPRLHYYASIGALTRIAGGMGRVLTVDNLFTSDLSERLNLTVYCIDAFQQIEVGPYQVLSVAANHAPETTAMLYLIERDGRTLFYGTDTGEMPQATWDALEAHGRPCDVVVLDHTFGMKGRSNGHMNHEQFMEQVDKFRSLGLLAADARIYATHLAHHSNPTHEELTAFAAERGYIPAYDGLVVEI